MSYNELIIERGDIGELTISRAKRVLCVLVLDTSSSMSGPAISNVNTGLQTIEQRFRDAEGDYYSTVLATEVAIVTFGHNGVSVGDFVEARAFRAPVLRAGGSTPMGPALVEALNLLRNRKDALRRTNGSYFRPMLFVLTDGAPDSGWEEGSRRLSEEVARNGVAGYGLGIPPSADIRMLAQVMAGCQPPKMVDPTKMGEFFDWLTQLFHSVSRSDDKGPKAPSTGEWEFFGS